MSSLPCEQPAADTESRGRMSSSIGRRILWADIAVRPRTPFSPSQPIQPSSAWLESSKIADSVSESCGIGGGENPVDIPAASSQLTADNLYSTAYYHGASSEEPLVEPKP